MKVVLCFLTALFAACTPLTLDNEEVVASLGNKELLLEDIQDQLPKAGEVPKADSIALVETLVQNWARNELLVEAAEFNLKEDLRNFDELVSQYRNDLLKHAYIERYVNENLDTTVSTQEIEAYYKANQQNFELKESIIKASYTAAPLEAKQLKDARKWFMSTRNEDKYLDWIEVFATKQSAFTDSSWVPMEHFL